MFSILTIPIQVYAEEAFVRAHDEPVPVDEAGGEGVLDHRDGIVQHLPTAEHGPVGQLVLLEDPVQLVQGHHPLGLLGLGVGQHEALVSHAGRVHERSRYSITKN